ncbi:MAG TPA: hypothetical protein VGR76_11060 [Candidatus Angelobacter sp.]|nr:hypothetical protein [Candidatus Angelobacter sp.]
MGRNKPHQTAPVKVTRTKHNGRECWRVSWEERKSTKRRFFASKQAANDFASAALDELKAHGEAWSALPAAARAELSHCYKIAEEKGYSIAEACRYFEQNGPRTTGKITLSDLVQRFTKAKSAKNLRPQSLRILGITLEQFLAGRENRQASSVTSAEITTWLDSRSHWGPWRRRGVIIDLGNLFRWGVRNHLLDRNPIDGVERPVIDHNAPAVLSVEAASKLLKLCRSKYRKLLPWLVISLFAGLRAGEVERITWDQISDGFIDLRATQTKGRARRLVTVRPTLKAWLDICRKKKGPVCVERHQHLAIDFRKAAGGLAKNVLRHSFISYAIAAKESVATVAMESGNSEAIIFRHYREIVTPEQAKDFWAMIPKAI